jgi:peptide/nickel transport system substrate-binding protein
MTDDTTKLDRRSLLTLAGAGALSLSLAGCTGDGGSSGGTPAATGTETGTDDATTTADTATPTGTSETGSDRFPVSVMQGQMATTLDPHDHRETSTRSVLLQAYERIITRDRAGRVVSRLATDWERVSDGEVRFTVREGVTFHDGQSLTAADCAYSIRRVVDDDVHITSPQSGQLAGVTGAEAESETDLRVRSDGFNPVVVASLASYCPVMSEEWTEAREPSEVAQAANGTGPYRITDYETDVSVAVEAFDGYWGGTPDVTAGTVRAASEASTRVNALRASETDVVTNVPPGDAATVQAEGGTRIEAVPSTRNLFVVLNYARPPFDSRAFRRAVNYAVDLDAIIENVLDGFGDPTSQPTIEGTVGHADDLGPYPYDPERAADLVDESGYGGTEFVIHTPVGRYLRDFEVAQAVAGYVDDLPNVSCGVQQRDFGSLITEFTDGNLETSPDAFLIGSSNPSRDASQKFNSWLLPSAATSQVTDETYARLYERAQAERDAEVRAELLADINRRAHDEAALLFLHRQYSVYGVSSRVDWSPRQDELVLLEEFDRR